MEGVGSRARGVVAVCLAALAVLLATAGTAAASQAQYDKAYRIGLAAYTYGLPLLDTDITFRTMTSIDVSKGAYGPVNRFNNVRKLNNPDSTAVVAPGASTLSSIAWVDLRSEPQVLHVPRVLNHYFVLALLDPYTTDLRNLGTVHDTRPGDYVLLGPGQHGLPIPAGTHRIDVRYSRLWIVGSTQLRGNVGPQERPPHPGPLRAHAAEPVRHGLPAQAAGAPAHAGDDLQAAARAALLRRARPAARALPAAGARPRGIAAVRQGRYRPRHAGDGQPEPEP